MRITNLIKFISFASSLGFIINTYKLRLLLHCRTQRKELGHPRSFMLRLILLLKLHESLESVRLI